MKLKKLSVLLLSAAVLTAAAEVKSYFIEMRPGNEQDKKAYLAQPFRIWSGNDYKAAKGKYNGLLVLANSKVSFVFSFEGKVKDGSARNVTVGMRKPSPLNWYSGGFFAVNSGKNKLSDGKFTMKEVKGGAEYGYAEMEFSDAPLTGKVRFELANDDDKLLMTFTPGNENGYTLWLYAYPGSYGTPQLRSRKIITNLGEVKGNMKRLTPGEYWAVFGDSYYDRANSRGDGCCALLFNPKDFSSFGIVRSGYACTASFYNKKKTPVSLVLWDFKGWSMKQAVDYMKKLDVKFE